MTSIASKILSFWLLGCFALENSFANGECKFCEGDFTEAKALPSSITSGEDFPDTVKTCGDYSDIVVTVNATSCVEAQFIAGYCECTTTPVSCNFCEGGFTKDKALPAFITDIPELTKTCGQWSDLIKPITDLTECDESKILGGYCGCTTSTETCKFCDGDFTKDKALPGIVKADPNTPKLVETCGQYSDMVKTFTDSSQCSAAKMAAVEFCECTTASPTVAPTAATTSESPSSSGFRRFFGVYPQLLVLLTALYTNLV